jgi:hypothetical protein
MDESVLTEWKRLLHDFQVLQCSHLRVAKVAGGAGLKQIRILPLGSFLFSFRRAYVILGSCQLPATSLRRLISCTSETGCYTTFFVVFSLS